MALKATIFKIGLQIADLDRNYFQDHNLTLARHPSETDERMMARVLAFALYANEALVFGKGLAAEDEPDLWRKDLTGAIEQWIEVGLPDEKRVRRACGRASEVVVVTYGGRVADMWWQQNQAALQKQERLSIFNLSPDDSRALAKLASRGMSIQCTVQEGEVWMISEGESLRIAPEIRQACRKSMHSGS